MIQAHQGEIRLESTEDIYNLMSEFMVVIAVFPIRLYSSKQRLLVIIWVISGLGVLQAGMM